MAIKKRKTFIPGAFEASQHVALFVDGKKVSILTYSEFIKEYRRLKDLRGIEFKTIDAPPTN